MIYDLHVIYDQQLDKPMLDRNGVGRAGRCDVTSESRQAELAPALFFCLTRFGLVGRVSLIDFCRRFTSLEPRS